MIELKPLPAAELDLANLIYREIDFLPASPRDFVAAARHSGDIVALGRLVPVDDQAAELGGIWVAPPWRGQGAATAVVRYLLDVSQHARLYCVPFVHLTAFYRRFGFEPAPAQMRLPCAIAEKLGWCRTRADQPADLLVRERC